MLTYCSETYCKNCLDPNASLLRKNTTLTETILILPCGQSSFKESLGIMLACFETTQPLPKHARQSQEPGKSKKQVHNSKNGSNKPETQWFCVHNDDLNFFKKILNTKRSAAVFLMRMGLCKRLIAGLTKRFGYFGAPKYHATAA